MKTLPEPVPFLLFGGVTALTLRIVLVFTIAFLKTALRKKTSPSPGSVFEDVTLQAISVRRDFYLPRRVGSESPDVDGLKPRINQLVSATRWLGLLGASLLVWGVGLLLTAHEAIHP